MRDKQDTVDCLKKVYALAKTIGSKTKSKELKTEQGVKDGYLEFFIEKIYAFIKDLPGNIAEKQVKLDNYVEENIPQSILSPSLRIKGEHNSNILFLQSEDIRLTQGSILRETHQLRYFM